MACERHANHSHTHQEGCGHTAIRQGNSTAYLHDGHLHQAHGDHVDETRIGISSTNPDICRPDPSCGSHAHGPGCGHEQVPHGSHTDYLVGDQLHHVHDDHCDDHGRVEVLSSSSRAA